MNFKNYEEYINYLKSFKDEKYKKFHSSLVLNSKYDMIGIRVPIMRNIAKEVAKTMPIEDFLEITKDIYYEDVMIQGLVISHIKDEKTFNKYFEKYIKKVDNWALCDSFCSSIKIIRKYENKYFNKAVKMALDEQEFISRIGLVIILNHFTNDKNVDTILNLLNTIKNDKFYVNMAEAWLICELYINFPQKTKNFIEQNNLNKFTHNKAISKIHDSFRVSKDEKEYLNSLKR